MPYSIFKAHYIPMKTDMKDNILVYSDSVTLYSIFLNDCYLPIKTDTKNKCIGIFSIGDAMFRNQLGDIGNSRRNSRKKNKLSMLSWTCEK